MKRLWLLRSKLPNKKMILELYLKRNAKDVKVLNRKRRIIFNFISKTKKFQSSWKRQRIIMLSAANCLRSQNKNINFLKLLRKNYKRKTVNWTKKKKSWQINWVQTEKVVISCISRSNNWNKLSISHRNLWANYKKNIKDRLMI